MKGLDYLKKIVILMAIIASTLIVDNANAEFQVPIVRETNQWKLERVNPSKEDGLIESEKGKFDVYGLYVINKGKKAYNVRVEAFRNVKGTKTMFGLAPQMMDDELETSKELQFLNFPINANSDMLEIVITWEDEPQKLKNGEKFSGRKYKETFLITP